MRKWLSAFPHFLISSPAGTRSTRRYLSQRFRYVVHLVYIVLRICARRLSAL